MNFVIDECVELDYDINEVLGIFLIFDIIFDKIFNVDVFVVDVLLILCCLEDMVYFFNFNVMLELGYVFF